ncbi:MAG: tRNA (adenosine(37)-N6)-threonylcarbamoyltransferase complex transferase subunit TsaD [Clostridia bacterium]|nr:tRNA (adenosine(37)-N6)-threonylcarbamoyltransferase complex transferase subunit TsaD [Clostridia bacterium]
MIILGIESSCDETAASVINAEEGGKMEVYSNIVSSQISIHALYGGVVPEIASRAHCEAITNVVRKAMENVPRPEAVAVTFAPGLIGSLLVGVGFAKSLASAMGIPLIPVDHIKAHVAAAHLENTFSADSYNALVVSGGHTSIYRVNNDVDFCEIGSTRDDACGEAFDKVGRVLGLPYPGGAAMDRLAQKAFELFGTSGKEYIPFPSPAVGDETSFDYSFSGLKTAVINYVNNEKQRNRTDVLSDDLILRIAGSFTRTVCSGVTSKLEAAMMANPSDIMVLAGGVAANSHLRKAVKKLCDSHGVKLIIPSVPLCGDNGAMVASAGFYSYKAGYIADSSLNAYASDEGSKAYLDKIKEKASVSGNESQTEL